MLMSAHLSGPKGGPPADGADGGMVPDAGGGPAPPGGSREPRSRTPRGPGDAGGSRPTAPGIASPTSTVAIEAAEESVSESATGTPTPQRGGNWPGDQGTLCGPPAKVTMKPAGTRWASRCTGQTTSVAMGCCSCACCCAGTHGGAGGTTDHAVCKGVSAGVAGGEGSGS